MTSGMAEETAHSNSPLGSEEHLVIFRLANEFYGIDIQSVQEIVRMQTIAPIPGSEPWVVGITNLRGRAVPVIDLRRRCGVGTNDHTAETRIVVIGRPTGMVGFIVDAVSEVLRIPAEQVEQPTSIASSVANSFFRGMARLGDRLVFLMDLEGVLSGAPIDGESSAIAA